MRGSKTTRKIESKLNCGSRTIRQTLSRLEKEGILRRELGKKVNSDFRFSDKWYINKQVSINENVPKDKLCIGYNNSPFYYKFIPKEIEINELVASSCGLIVAEATKTKFRSLEFVNSEPIIIKQILKFLRYLDADISNVRWRIIFSGRLKKLYTRKEENLCRTFWIHNTNLLSKNEQKSSPNYIMYKSKNIRNIIPWGSANIMCNNIIMRYLVFNLVNKVKKLAVKEKKFSIWYLRGYLIGEAYIGKNDKQIQIASTHDDELQILKSCLENLDIYSSFSKATSTSPKKLIMNRLDSFIKLYNYGITNLHPYKKLALLTKVLNYKNLDNELRIKMKQDLENLTNFIDKREYRLRKLKTLM